MIIDGKKIAKKLRDDIAKEVATLDRKPGLAVVLIGNNPASKVYVANKEKSCQEVGFYSIKIQKSAQIKQQELLEIIQQLNHNDKIDGILVQLPLPKQLDSTQILQAICPSKDVDGFHCENIGKLMQNQPFLRPCTPKGIMHLLAVYDINPTAKNCVIVGASNIVGRPMAMELLNQGATVTICNSKTQNLTQYLKNADIIVVAVGIAKMITAQMLKQNCTVIDVGINHLEDGSLSGDVDFNDVKDKVGFITPVPGGVGPMTIVSLLDNTLMAYKQHIGAIPFNK